MKIGFYQFDVAHGQPKVNHQKVKKALQGKVFDLMVLPELFTTGYLFASADNLLPHTEDLSNSATVKMLQKLLQKTQAHIIAGIAEKEGDRIYNTAILVNARGLVGKQRKVHLTRLEKTIFSPGSTFNLLKAGDVPIGIITCFDAWFPEASRQLMEQGAQILCQPANFGGTHTLDIMKVRAMENVVFTITANRIGQENEAGTKTSFRGESQITDPAGKLLSKTTQSESLQIMEIDPEQAKQKDNVMCDDFEREWKRYS